MGFHWGELGHKRQIKETFAVNPLVCFKFLFMLIDLKIK